MILKVADKTESEEIAHILEDRIIDKFILTNCASSLKNRMKFNEDKQKALQLHRNKTSKAYGILITGDSDFFSKSDTV